MQTVIHRKDPKPARNLNKSYFLERSDVLIQLREIHKFSFTINRIRSHS